MKEKAEWVEVKKTAQVLAGATLEAGTATLLDNLPALGTAAAEIIGNEAVSTVVQTLTGGLLGAVAPGFLGLKLSFQQRRFERNIVKMLNAVAQKQDIIEQRLNQLDPEIRQKFMDGPYRDVLFDNIIAENQEQKVQDNINGYINLMGLENPNDDVIFTFFHTLSQMNELDIRVLRLYRPAYGSGEEDHENFMDVMREENIDDYQYDFIREKLWRLGMLDSKSEANRDENLDVLGKTLTELIKQLYSKKPKEVKAPKLKKIARSESYSITRLGRQYLAFIDEPQ